MVEGARLESVYTSQGYRGFESLTLRQANKKPPKRRFFLFPRVWAKLACERTEGNKKRQAQLLPFCLLEAYPVPEVTRRRFLPIGSDEITKP